ncbi:MAG: hypothetical protein NVSMB25_10550 [Thermoleophilaceae bacterium]
MDEGMRPVLRAAGIAAFTVGLLLVLLRPPSLAGAAGLAAIVAGAAAFVIVIGWVWVRLMGADQLNEEAFEHVVRRSEALASHPQPSSDPDEFESLVAEAIDRLPREFAKLLDTTAVVVSARGAEHGAYGHYFGDTIARSQREHRIVLYRDTLERDFGFDRELLATQLERTLRHELAHHLGWDEQGVRGLGL